MLDKSNLNIELLVVSCDSYSDVWNPFFYCFFNNWKDCPLKINLTSNYKLFHHPNVNNIKVGKDLSWSDNLLKAIEYIRGDYIFLFLEDLFLKQVVSNDYYNEILIWIKKHEPNCLRLTISHKPLHYDDLIGKIPLITPYKIYLMIMCNYFRCYISFIS